MDIEEALVWLSDLANSKLDDDFDAQVSVGHIRALLASYREQEALLGECEKALDGVIAVADRKTVEFDRARAILTKLKERKD